MRFYWLCEGVLAGCSRPGGPDSGENLEGDLSRLRQQGIGAILSLTESPIDESTLARVDLASLHLPIPDLTAPLPAQIDQALRFLDAQRVQGRPVAVHCRMGQGRTGVILAAYLIRNGWTAEDALSHLRTLCPGAISESVQEEGLRTFAAQRAWVL
ncbi:MAG: dual specificity protein phosphatase family protein [Chloroflexota bacterium]|nr:dual specificity protein phosphatase family protein [Chloroflexota bacterium]